MTTGSLAAPDTAAVRKARGAFFTPEPVARYIAEWAIRTPADRILEPSCGEAAFLLAAADRIANLRAAGGDPVGDVPVGDRPVGDQPVGDEPAAVLDGVELHESSAIAARALLSRAGVSATVTAADFFSLEPAGGYDAVVGNPPYVRYQDFAGEDRARSRAAALRAGVPLTGLASSWAAFTVHAALFLKPGGRLGLVLPAELLSVNYAGQVRAFLMRRFARVDVVLFTERVFPGVQEEVLLLLADGYRQGPTDETSIRQVRNVGGLSAIAAGRTWRPARPDDKWTPALLPSAALAASTALLGGPGFTVLQSWAETTLGMVTGNNRYFALSPARVAELGLAPSEVIRLSPPGSGHLRGLSLTAAALDALGEGGAATRLFRPAGAPTSAAAQYISAGEDADVHTAYKCRVRTPWWRVPLVAPADLLLTYMNADTPRLSTNRAGAHHLNSVHGVYLRPGLEELGRDLLPLGSLTSMTLLGAETVGRAYGGGMLKLEPREADRLPVPEPALLQAATAGLAAVRPSVGRLLGAGRLTEAAALVDGVLLIGELGVSRGDVRELADAHAELTARRVARGSRGPG